MGIKNSKIKRSISLVLSLLLIVNILNPAIAVSAANKTEADFTQNPFAVFSAGKDPLVFNTENAEITGSVYSRSDITAQYSKGVNVSDSIFLKGKTEGNITCKGSINNSVKSELPDILYFLECSAQYGSVIDGNAQISEREIDLSENSLKVDGTLYLNKTKLINSGYITAENSIIYDVPPVTNENSDVIITSENGDITINGSNITINGLIYAPNGKIQINAKNVTINGGVYGKEIEFNATNLNVNYKEDIVSKVIPQLIVDAGEDKIVYVDQTALLEGSVNYKEVQSQWELVSGPDGCEIENPKELSSKISFTKDGEYVFKLTCSMDLIKGEDTVTVTVKPAPCKTYTTTKDFGSGESENLDMSNNELKLSSPSNVESQGYSKEYTNSNPSGIKVNNTVSKSAVVSYGDSLNVDYELSGYGSVEVSKGIDFILLIDSSGSMYGSYLTNAQEAAKEIVGFMSENDRYAVSSLGARATDFTNDVTTLNNAIDNIKRYNGSSNFGNGLKIALDYFDLASDSERQKYVIVLTDGENGYGDDDVAYAQAQRALESGVKIYSLAMNSQRLNMQQAAIISKGIYKYCPDAASIKEFMVRLAQNIFTGAGRKISLRTTVTDKSFVDIKSLNPAPAEVKENDDGSLTLIWNLSEMEIDQKENFSLPIKTSALAADEYKVITRDTTLTYYDKDGNGHILYLDDIILPGNDRKPEGSWSAVYDSQREGCVWTGAYYNALYKGNSDINVYVSASDDPEAFPERKEIKSFEELENIIGRYIKVEADLFISDDGSSPVLYDVTVTSEADVKEIPTEKINSTEIKGRNTVPENKPLSLYLGIKRNDLPVDKVEWSVSGEGETEISAEGELLKTFVFKSAGEYTVTAKTVTGATYYECSYTVTVTEAETLENIGNGSETVDYNLKMEVSDLPEVVSYGTSQDINISFSDESQLAWMRVVYNDSRYDRLVNVSDDYKASINFNYYSNNTHTVTVQAFDWAGDMIEKKFEVFVDGTNPTGSLTLSKSSVYLGDSVTVTTAASDNYGVESVKLTVNGEELEIKEDGTAEFTPKTAGNCNFELLITDKAGRTATYRRNITAYEDTTKPNVSISSTSGTRLYLGLDSTLTFNVSDGQTGIKSINTTLNGEEIKLDEENKYLFVPTTAGAYTFKCTALDNRDNETVKEYTINVLEDNVRPSVYINTSNSKANVGGSVTVTVTATDNVKVTDLKFFVNGAETKLDENNEYVFTALEEHIGTVKFSATAKDAKDNEYTYTRSITVQEKDITAPNVYLSLISEIALGNKNAYMTVTANDDIEVSKLEVTVNGEAVELDSNSRYYFDTSDFFTYDVAAKATDSSGNETVKTASTKVVDKTAPKVTISADKSSYNTGDTIVYTVKITDNGKLKEVYAAVNGEEVKAGVSTDFTITVENSQAGSCALYIKATDESGNSGEYTRTVTVKDTVAPQVLLASDKSKYSKDETPVIYFDVSDNVGVSSVTATLNGAEIRYADGKLLLPGLWEIGTYKLSVTVQDAAGNKTTKEIQFEIEAVRDSINPTIKNITYQPSLVEVGSTMKIGLEASDDSGSVSVTVTANGIALTLGGDGKYVYTPTKSGECVIFITAEDPAGNKTTASFTVYVYESISGHRIRADVPGIVKTGEKVEVKLYATDGKDFDSTELTLDGKPLTPVSKNVYEFTASEAKKYTLVATGRDNNGFVDTFEFYTTAAVIFKDTVESGVYDEYLTSNDEIRIPVGFEDKIEELATPAAVYEYFTNNIRYESYINSRKGGAGTLEQFGGNDVDQASLLIAALRHLKYPARYVSGKIVLNEAQAKSLFGTDDIEVAAQIIANSKRAVTKQIGTNGEKFIVMDHTWVEAYVPYSAVSNDADKADYGIWVELDTSIKPSAVTERSGDNVTTPEEKTAITNLINGMGKLGSGFEDIRESAENIYGNAPEKAVWYETTITKQKFDLLPSELQYNVEKRNSPFGAVTTAMSDTLSFKVPDEFYIDSYDLGTVKTARVYGKRVTVSFVPASESDQALLDKYNGDYTKISAQSMNMTPVLKIDGEIVKKVGYTVKLGKEIPLNITIKTGGTSTTETDMISAGSMYAIAIDLMRISGFEIAKSYDNAYTNAVSDKNNYAYSDELLGAYLDTVGKMYFNQNDLNDGFLANQYKVNSARNTAFAVLGYEFETRENIIGQVTGLDCGRFFIDVDYNISYSSSLDNNDQDRKDYFSASSFMGSYLESTIWEQVTGVDSVSTIEIFEKSLDAGISLNVVNSSNYNSVKDNINIDSSAKSEITSAVNAGYTVVVPEKEIKINDWEGTGYAILDVKNAMSATYRISGGLSGGSATQIFDLMKKDKILTLDDAVWECYRVCSMIASLQLIQNLADAVEFTVKCQTGTIGMSDVVCDFYGIMDGVKGAAELYAGSLECICDYILEDNSDKRIDLANHMFNLAFGAIVDVFNSIFKEPIEDKFKEELEELVPLSKWYFFFKDITEEDEEDVDLNVTMDINLYELFGEYLVKTSECYKKFGPKEPVSA